MAITNKYNYVYETNPEYSDLYVDSFIKALSSSNLPQDTFDSIIASTFGKPAAAPVTTPAATQITTPVTNTTAGGITDLVAAPTTNTTTANTNTAVTTPVVTTPVTTTTTGGITDLVAAPADNITSTGGYTKSATAPTSGAVSKVVEGDNIDTQISQLPVEVSHWARSADQRYMELIDDKTGKVLERRAVGDFSDLDLLKTGLSFVPGAGQILAGVNIADALRTGNLTGALIGATGLDPSMANINTALRVGQAVDSNNTLGALTALAGNKDLLSLTGADTANVGGFTAKDAMAAGNLVQAANTGNYGGVISNLGTLTGSSDAQIAGRAVTILTRLENGDIRALNDAVNLSNSVTTGATTKGTGSTTVGNFEDTEVTRLKGLGYTNQQIQDYFNRLENTTDALDTAVTGTTTAGLPTGVQLASLGDGVFRTDVGGVPTYAESANASSVTVPFGYSLLSTAEADNKPTGSYYDPTANAWFKPDTSVTDLLGSTDIQSDFDLFTSSVGDLDKIASTTATTSDDSMAAFLASIGITNTDQLADSGLSNQDILDMINAGTDTVTVTGAKGNDTVTGIDTITGGAGNDNIDTVTVTGAKGNDTITGIDTITGANGNDLVIDDKGEVIIKDKKEFCPVGTVLNPETGDCDPIDETLTCPPGKVLNDAGTACIDEVVIKDKKDFCPVGTVLNPETGECDPIDDTKKPLDCPEGYEPNEAGTACIPVVTITDKKCQPGYVYDEDLQMCVPETQTPLTCPTGFHLSDDGLSCVADTKETLKCPVGYELNDAGTECIPVVEIKDKKCQPGFVYDEELKQCVPIKEDTCPTGFHKDNSGKCVPDETTCPTGFHKDAAGACVPDETTLTCPEGYELNEAGTACIPVIEIKDKKCGPGFVYDEDLKQCVPIKEDTCPTGFHKDESGKCVPDTTELKCPEGYELNEAGTACIPVIEIKDKKCQPGYVYDEDLQKCVPIEEGCAPGFHEENGICVPDDDEECKAGYEKVDGVCVPVCQEGYIRNLATGTCEKVEDKACPPGQVKNAEGKCVPIVKPPPPKTCPTGYVLVGDTCVPIPKTLTATSSTSGLSASGEKTDPIYAGGMDSFNLLATLEQLLAETDAKKDTKETKQKTKMATGGHLDDLLAEQMTVDDLLKLLR